MPGGTSAPTLPSVPGTPLKCHLAFTLGRAEPCPERACPFWDGRCSLEQLGAELERSDLVRYLAGLRLRLEQADGPARDEALLALSDLVAPAYAGCPPAYADHPDE